MNTISLERTRIEFQMQCDEQRTQAERNKLGQFATPFALARAIVEASVRLLPQDEPIHFLDPAFGSGAFYSALLDVCPKRIESARGYEIDRHYGDPAQRLWEPTGLRLTLGDFTRVRGIAPANLLICNPPYVRHHHLSFDEKVKLQEQSAMMGIRLSGLAGLYCYFMLLAHRSLQPDAVSAWLVPSEFMDVNYGDGIKQYLLQQVTLLRIHRFDPSESQFADALVSSAVVWFKNTAPAQNAKVQMSFGGTFEKPLKSSLISPRELEVETKWTRVLRPKTPTVLMRAEGRLQLCLGDVFTIKRGLATGDNRFFILNEQQVAELGISRKFLKPILPSPRYLKQDTIEADSSGIPLLDTRLFLIDCPLEEEALKSADPALFEYLKTGEETTAKGYLCRSRSPWYSQENRPPPPFLCTYMGRARVDGTKTFRFILNLSKATAANVYLLMYPKAALKHVFKDAATARRVFEQLSRIPMVEMTGEGRVYGGGLHKLEPRELANVPVDELAPLLGTSSGMQYDLALRMHVP